MTHTGRRVLAIVIAGIGWAALVANAFSLLPSPHVDGIGILALGMAVTGTGNLMLNRYQRPLGAAFEMGYSAGRRDFMRESNGRGPQGGRPVFPQRQSESA